MAKKIGIRMYLDGAPKFNSDIKNINASLKQFQSELKKNSEEFKASENSLEALSRKSETLSKAYDTASQKVETYARRLEEINKARSEEEQRLTSYKTALEDEQRKLAEVEQQSGKNSEAYTKQAATVQELESKVKVSSDALQRLDSDEVKLTTSLNNATAEQLKYGTELEKTNGYLAEAEESTDDCAQSIDKFGKEVDKAGEYTEKMSETLEGIAKNEAFEKISEGAKKLLENMMECAEVAEQFEYSIAKVQSIAQVSGDELGHMSSEIRRVATEMGYGANEVAEATYQAISASVDAADAVGFVEDTTKLARAGFTEVTTAVDVLTTAINAYGQEANTTAHIADDLITTQNLGKTTVDELAQSMGTIIPTASAYGVSLDQLSSAYVILTKQGINTANATTYLRGMLNELGDSGSDVSEILQAQTGHSFGELTQMGYTLGDVLQILGDSVHGNTEAFANLFGNIRAGQGALAIFNQGADTFNSTLEVMQNNAGATDRAFAIMADTAVMVNERFESSVENLKIAIGETLSPTIADLKSKGIDILDTMTEVVEQNPQLVAALAGGAAAVTGLAIAATTAATAISLLRLAFGDVSAVAVLAITGVVAAGGALTGLALASNNAKDSLSELTGKYEEQVEATRNINQATDEYIADSQKQGEFADKLATKITNLNDKEHLSATEKKELRNAVNELNAIYPELNLAINEQTGYLAENTEGWRENLEAIESRQKAAFAEEQLSEVYSQQAENEYALWEIDQRLMELREERAQTEQHLASLQERSMELNAGELQLMSDLYDKGEELDAEEQALTSTKAELTAQSEELNGSIEKLNSFMDEAAGATGEAAAAGEGYADSLGVMHDSMQAAADASDAIKDAIERASAAIGEQIGLFDEWNSKSELTFEQMQQRWKDQNEGLEEYKNDLSYVKGVIDSETDPAIKNLAENMVNMGADGAAELHEFVEGLKSIGDNTDAMKDLAETWQEHLDSIAEAEDIYASITLQEQGYVEDSTALFTQYYADSESAQQEYNEAMVELAETGISDQATAIEATAPEVESATKTAGENAVSAMQEALGVQRGGGRSTVFYNMGTTIMKSLADGINDGSGTVASALQKSVQNAIDKMDLSGITEKINKKLGEAMQK